MRNSHFDSVDTIFVCACFFACFMRLKRLQKSENVNRHSLLHFFLPLGNKLRINQTEMMTQTCINEKKIYRKYLCIKFTSFKFQRGGESDGSGSNVKKRERENA